VLRENFVLSLASFGRIVALANLNYTIYASSGDAHLLLLEENMAHDM
jgi:hypothetical protein